MHFKGRVFSTITATVAMLTMCTGLARPSAAATPGEAFAFAINSEGVAVGQSATKEGHLHAVRWDRDGEITDLGTLPGDESHSHARGLNDKGVIVGRSRDAESNLVPVKWDPDGKIVKLPILPGGERGNNDANDVNDAGVAVGQSGSVSRPKAVKWDAAGKVTELKGLTDSSSSSAFAINENGEIAGRSTDVSNLYQPVVWDVEGNIRALKVPPGAAGLAAGLNDRSLTDRTAAVGEHVAEQTHTPLAVRWDPDGSKVLELLKGTSLSRGYDINNLGMAVGHSYALDGKGPSRAVRWDTEGKVSDLGALSGGNDSSRAFGINNDGLIVGESSAAEGLTAVRWELDGTITNLGTLPAARSMNAEAKRLAGALLP